jgi:RNA polymerase sigma-70 factor (ECF subfamily)
MIKAENSHQNIVFDDQLLARKCSAGDNTAMGLLITKYQDQVYNTILKICQNQNDALELTQDTFVKVIENIGSFKGSSRLFTWIYRIAVNLTLNYCKRKMHISAESLDDDQSGNLSGRKALKEYLADKTASDPAMRVENAELAELASQALRSLNDEQRTVIILRDIDGLGYSEIAEILELEIGTVKSRISRAREALRTIFEAMAE